MTFTNAQLIQLAQELIEKGTEAERQRLAVMQKQALLNYKNQSDFPQVNSEKGLGQLAAYMLQRAVTVIDKGVLENAEMCDDIVEFLSGFMVACGETAETAVAASRTKSKARRNSLLRKLELQLRALSAAEDLGKRLEESSIKDINERYEEAKKFADAVELLTGWKEMEGLSKEDLEDYEEDTKQD